VIDWIRLAPATALPRGAAARVRVDGEAIAICHTVSGYRAVDDYCPHMGGPLSQGTLSGDTVTCPWHGWRYDLLGGARADRAGQPVRTYPTTVREGWIFLSPDPGPGLERAELEGTEDESRQC
jgi:nitrite reductase/ring-hydroxylating ferredoxin subunit